MSENVTSHTTHEGVSYKTTARDSLASRYRTLLAVVKVAAAMPCENRRDAMCYCASCQARKALEMLGEDTDAG